jgi:hypothetical protein
VIEFGAELEYRGYGFRAHRFALPRNDERLIASVLFVLFSP